MSEIDQVHEQVWIADIQGARTADKDRFDAVITTCQDSIEDNVSQDVSYHHFNMSDGETSQYGGYADYDIFERATKTILSHLEKGHTILVHCHMGRSRSVSTTVAAISAYHEKPMWLVLADVEDARPQVNPNYHLLDHAKEFVTRRGIELL